MTITIEIKLEVEPWFEGEKTINEWDDFFNAHLMPDSSVIGVDDEEEDLVAIRSFSISTKHISK